MNRLSGTHIVDPLSYFSMLDIGLRGHAIKTDQLAHGRGHPLEAGDEGDDDTDLHFALHHKVSAEQQNRHGTSGIQQVQQRFHQKLE